MTIELYDDREQGERVRAWIKENGGSILIGLALAIGAVYGYRQWQVREENRNFDAARLYVVVQNALDSDDLDAAAAAYANLGEYSKNLYRTLAGMQLAAAYVDGERPREALTILDELRQSAGREFLPLLALRQARLLIADGQPARALELLAAQTPPAPLAALVAEVRGDAYLAQGEKHEALAAYREALALSASERGLLNMKWQALTANVGPADAHSNTDFNTGSGSNSDPVQSSGETPRFQEESSASGEKAEQQNAIGKLTEELNDKGGDNDEY